MAADDRNATPHPRRPERLVDVLARIEADRRTAIEEDRRRFRRFVVRGEALLEPLNRKSVAESRTLLLRDIGYAGIGFLAHQPLDPESMWRVRFQHDDQGAVVGSQPVIIRSCRMVQPNLYMVGAEFIIEPYLLSLLGIDSMKLRQETFSTDTETEVGLAEYSSPDALS